MALIVAMTAIAILSVMVADMHENTSTAFAIAVTHRDKVQAEYMAKSGLNLPRLLVAQEPKIRQLVTPLYQMFSGGRRPPQLPVWTMANDILKPFCAYEEGLGSSAGIDFGSGSHLDEAPGTCEIVAVAENAKINVNSPLNFAGDRARRSIAMQLFAMMGGYQSPSPYDPLFAERDADGQHTSRIDMISALIDWWDVDTDRTNFDPGNDGEVTSSGAEEDIYGRLDDPYRNKNAPFDSLAEVRLIRGVGDDWWSTFVEPEPGDPTSRVITIYGSGSVNPNEAPPEVLLARLCSFLEEQPLCSDPAEAAKFIQLLSTARMMIPLPFFTRAEDFVQFAAGQGGSQDLYPMLVGFLGEDNPLMFRPVVLPDDNARNAEIAISFVTAARILNVVVTGRAGRAEVRLDTVLNFHDRWTPPPPNSGSMPGLGIFHYYRVD